MQKIKRQNKNKKNKRERFSIFHLNLILSIMLLAFGVIYLFMLNAVTVSGYKLKKMETKLADLKNENKNLNLERARAESMENILSRVSHLGLVQVGRFEYLSMPPTTVVKK